MIWAINDSALRSGIYYHDGINALAVVSDSTWFIVGAEEYPLSNRKRIGDL